MEGLMKQQRLRFRVVALLLIGLLVLAGGYGILSVSRYGNRWVNSTRNARFREAKSGVRRGDILDRNGVLIATTDESGNRVYQSNTLARSALVHVLGDTEGNVANGVDSFQASYLLGMKAGLEERILSLLSGGERKGDTLTLTIDSALSTEIVRRFMQNENTKGLCGAVVVMNYQTGEVLALVSLPVYDPINITDPIKNSTQHPFWNRAVQSTLPPGSTFKIVTAVCALENIPEVTSREFTCTGATQVGDQLIRDYNLEKHDTLSLQRAFRVSCNNVFSQIALTVGDSALRTTAENFGFGDHFLFRDIVVEDSVYPTTDRTDLQVAWSGFGQSRVVATPLHMCMVAAAIANDGVMMEPRLLSGVKGSSGVERLSFTPKVYRRSCSAEDAKTLQIFMKDVVKQGTGTRAAVKGYTVAGKTGSAESSSEGRDVTHAWFVGYIEEKTAPYAICVLVEEGGSGGGVAAPVAGEILQWLTQNEKAPAAAEAE